ncbi:MAG: serine/threonine-protein kinase [Pirellulales bacterium]
MELASTQWLPAPRLARARQTASCAVADAAEDPLAALLAADSQIADAHIEDAHIEDSVGEATAGEATHTELSRRLARAPGAAASAAAASAAAVPTAEGGEVRYWGKYEVRRLLGRGGQASAVLAWDPDLRRQVVLKIYRAVRTPSDCELVLQEGRALARVRSPFVAQCYGAERQAGVPYLVMEYVEGETLADVNRGRPLGLDRALELVGQVAEGVEAIHAVGLLHRDLKPSNIVIGADGRPRLIDFGLAAALGSDQLNQISGTPAYMAPEQARGETALIDRRTDIFGLGAVLYELLAGRPPYLGESLESVWQQARLGTIVSLRERVAGIRPAVNDLCMRSLERSPTARFASAADFRAAVEALRRGPGGSWSVTLGLGKWRIRLALGLSIFGLVVALTVPAVYEPGWQVASRMPEQPVRPVPKRDGPIPRYNHAQEVPGSGDARPFTEARKSVMPAQVRDAKVASAGAWQVTPRGGEFRWVGAGRGQWMLRVGQVGVLEVHRSETGALLAWSDQFGGGPPQLLARDAFGGTSGDTSGDDSGGRDGRSGLAVSLMMRLDEPATRRLYLVHLPGGEGGGVAGEEALWEKSSLRLGDGFEVQVRILEETPADPP